IAALHPPAGFATQPPSGSQVRQPSHGVCSQVPAPLQRSIVQGSPSSVHGVPPGSNRQDAEQQSPLAVLPSSHSSPASITPLPQEGSLQSPATPPPGRPPGSGHGGANGSAWHAPSRTTTSPAVPASFLGAGAARRKSELNWFWS